MATDEERLAAVEESLLQTRAIGQTILGIVQDTHGDVRSIQAHQTIIDSRQDTLDRQITAVKLDMQRSFTQVAGEFARIDKRLDGMATKQDLAETEQRMSATLAQLMTVLSDHLTKQLQTVLDERLPKKEE